jgi:hypothetical protein
MIEETTQYHRNVKGHERLLQKLYTKKLDNLGEMGKFLEI